MLEFVLDLIFDILFEGSAYVLESKKLLPTPIRIIASIIVVLLYLGISGVCVYIGVSSWLESQILAAVLFWGLALFFIIGGFYQTRKHYKTRKEN